MGLAPKTGAPQRVSAHVVPKAPAFAEEEEDKTTIESGWEEEASTTVEQGEVAEKIRAIGQRMNAVLPPQQPQRSPMSSGNITSTNSVIDEPTVDDQHANNLALSGMAPAALRARLMITHGNDTGQAIEVTPGKSYTIGRGIDNDFVLTDIAVSRKHFDLRHEAGSWVLADRGSGNGTIVNGQIEDQPFMLANGDVIEIGNTTFRFEQQNAPVAARGSGGTFDVDVDEEEPSTVAGKPVRIEEPATPALLAPPVRVRPKTVPPPPPKRPISASAPPPFGATARPSAVVPAQQPPPPSLGMPPGMQSQSQSQPLANLGMMQGRPNHPSSHEGMPPLANVLPTTIPGQGLPVGPSQPQILGMQFQPPQSYPITNPSDLHAQMHVSTNMPLRDATSTAHVPPTPYNGMPQVPQTYSLGPTISRRTKLVIGGAALTLLAAIATIAIIGGGEGPTVANGVDKTGDEGDADDKASSNSDQPDEKQDIAKQPDKAPIVDPKTLVDPKPTTPTITDKKPDVATIDKKPDDKKPEPTIIPDKKPDPKPEKVVDKKPDPKPEKIADKKPDKKPDPKPEKVVDKKPDPKPEKVADKKPTKKGDFGDVKNKADGLYRNKKFSEAASALKSAASGSSVSDEDVKELRSLAGVYEQLGRAYNVGMAPSTKKVEAFAALQTASTMDRNAGGAFSDEIKTKLAQVAPQAAISLAAAKNYEKAFLAVRVAESLGNRSGDTKTVRDILESAAGRLYSEAAKEIDSSPDAAKTKLRQIKGMVESSSPWYAKANKLLSSAG